MEKFLLIVIFLSNLSFNATGQKPGTPDYLLVKKGFSIFKLGESINKYTKYVTLNNYYDNDDSISIYKLKDPAHLPPDSGIKIKYMELRVNKGLIESIDIFVDKKYKSALLNNLKTDYGEARGKGSYFWQSKDTKIVLSYANGYKTTSMGRAIFVQTALNEIKEAGKIVSKSR
ncbi:MAG: hypothetical protein ACQPRJ_05235 [Solitalea-like symbiont of Acarus siro]